MIASLGKYEFEVAVENLVTFTDLKFQNSASYAEHSRLGRKSLLEFTGLNASTCSLNIHLEYGYAVDIYGAIDYFYTAMNDGEALAFMLGDDVMGEGLWVIESMDESYSQITRTGEALVVDLSLKLKEYIEDDEE